MKMFPLFLIQLATIYIIHFNIDSLCLCKMFYCCKAALSSYPRHFKSSKGYFWRDKVESIYPYWSSIYGPTNTMCFPKIFCENATCENMNKMGQLSCLIKKKRKKLPPSPKTVLLALWITSDSVSKGRIVATEPNISSCTAFIPSWQFVKTQGDK